MPSETEKPHNDDLAKKTAKQLPSFLVLLFVLLPLMTIAVYTTLQTFRDLHQFTLSRRQTIAFLTAATMRERIERVIDVGTALTLRVQFQELVESGTLCYGELWSSALALRRFVYPMLIVPLAIQQITLECRHTGSVETISKIQLIYACCRQLP